jgi:hypothetical protein
LSEYLPSYGSGQATAVYVQKTKFGAGATLAETFAAQARIPVMTVFEHWMEVLRCLNCGLAGLANLSQPKQVGDAIVIDNISEGFRAVSSQYGDTFFCEDCNRPATEIA